MEQNNVARSLLFFSWMAIMNHLHMLLTNTTWSRTRGGDLKLSSNLFIYLFIVISCEFCSSLSLVFYFASSFSVRFFYGFFSECVLMACVMHFLFMSKQKHIVHKRKCLWKVAQKKCVFYSLACARCKESVCLFAKAEWNLLKSVAEPSFFPLSKCESKSEKKVSKKRNIKGISSHHSTRICEYE